jgi:hypothetical protein
MTNSSGSGSDRRDETSPGLANDTIIGGSAMPADDGLDRVSGRMRVPGGAWTGDVQQAVPEPSGVTVVFTDEQDNLAGAGGESIRAVPGEDRVRGGMWVEGERGTLVGPADGPDTLSGALGESGLGEDRISGGARTLPTLVVPVADEPDTVSGGQSVLGEGRVKGDQG